KRSPDPERSLLDRAHRSQALDVDYPSTPPCATVSCRTAPLFVEHVFITGASSGFGLAVAKLLVAEGHEVWGTSRNLERIPKIPRWHAVRLDLADRLSVEEAFNFALTEAGYFDVLINNAGAGHFGPAEFLPMETIVNQFQILVFGQIQLMQLALHHMRTRA